MGAPVHSEIIIMKAFIFATVLAVATAYLADLPEVVEAKAAFQAVFDKYAAGEVALPVAPVHEVPAVVAPAAVAPVAYPYAHGYVGYPYAGYYGGYPYALPTVAVAPPKPNK